MGAIPWAPQFQNGDVRAKALMVDFDGLGHDLQPAAAASLRAFADEFESVFGVPFTISEAFRDIPTQDYYYDQMVNHGGNQAAYPGTSSHGQGLAVDINSWVYGNGDTDRHRWLVANAPRFGWSWELVGKPSGERWHFNYVGSWTAANFTPDKTPEQLEEEELMSARDEIIKSNEETRKAVELSRPLKLVAVIIPEIGFNGWVWVDQEGDWAVCPGDPYAKLVATWGFSQFSPIREVTSKAEWEYMTGQLLGVLNTGAKASQIPKTPALARAAAVAALPEETVLDLVREV